LHKLQQQQGDVQESNCHSAECNSVTSAILWLVKTFGPWKILRKIWGFHGNYEGCRLWDIKPSSYLTGNTLLLSYRAQPVNAM
jgi:hypothetical protein